MGYDMDLVVFKKKTLEKLTKLSPEYSISKLYSNYLFTYMYPEDYDIQEDEIARCICSLNTDVFSDFFSEPIANDEAIIIDKNTYYKMYKWLENKLKNITAYDFIENPNYEYEVFSYIHAYKNMTKEEIDFNDEIVIFQHNW